MSNYKINSAVVTGATGMIGIALIKKLLIKNIRVLAIVGKNSNRINNLSDYINNPLFEVKYCDIENYSQINNNNKYDVFYHFAWKSTGGNERNNVKTQILNTMYTMEAIDLAKRLGCKRFIGAGSQAEYGRKTKKLSSKEYVNPDNAYGICKYSAGKLGEIYANQNDIDFIWTRILSAYGPYDGSTTMIMSTIYKILQGQEPRFTEGEQDWDYIYKDDVAEAYYLIGEKGKNNKIYCIGSGKTKKIKEYINIIKDNIDSEINVRFGEIPYSDKQVMYLCADIDELQKDTGFIPKVDFEEGIKVTIEYCKNTLEERRI